MSDLQETPKARILIVEDEALIGLDLKKRLTNWGYMVLGHAFSAEKALESIENDPPDLILMDIVLQGRMDGIEAAEIIRNRWGIPVIFTTAHADRERIKQAKLTYPFGYLMKPYQDRDIEVTIEMALYVAKVDGERRMAEEALKGSEAKFRAIVDNSHDGILFCNAEATITYRSPSFIRINQFTNEERIGKSSFDNVHPDDLHRIREYWKEIVRHPGLSITDELRLRHKNGSWVWVECTAQNLLEHPYIREIIVTTHNITDRKGVEEALRLSEEKHRILLEESPDPIFSFEAGGRYVYVNKAFASGVGKDAGDIIGKTIWDVFPKEEADRRFAALEQTFKTGEGKTVEVRVPRPDGDQYYLTTLTPIKNKEGHVFSVICSSKNITERKQFEESMRRLHEDLSATVEAIPDLLFEVDRQGCFLNYHAPKELVLFVEPEKFLGKTVEEILPPEAAGLIQQAIRDAAEKGRHTGTIYSLPIGGEKKWFELSIAAKGDHKDPKARFIVLARDITERKKMEDEHLIMSKLESTGILAGGIAHDFNNLLAVILGNLEMIKMYDLDPREVNKKLDSVRKAALDARGLTHQLITLSKGGEPVKKLFAISALLKDQVKFALSGSSIGSEFSIPENLWPVEADQGQIGQVIRNIVINAKEAMKQGGIISISASNIIGAELTEPLLGPQNYVKISIADQGEGIPEEILPNIFDPYFSTKERGTQKGMGLGMTICRSIIEKHDGTITVETKPGTGTTFHIFLPSSRKSIPKIMMELGVMAGKGKILIMDDEDMMRDMLGSVIRRLGYEVELAEHGEKALEIYRQAMADNHPFDLVILDLTIRGGMGGLETLRKLFEINPKVKAVVASGYDQDPVMKNFDQYGFKGALQKPFMINELSEIMINALEDE
jgi:PAS domain S-box-containing protein